jgi:FkbM family methyltransferase
MEIHTITRDFCFENLHAGSPPDFMDFLAAKKMIFVYGAGAFGRETYRDLRKNGIPVTAFLDRAAQPGQTLFDLPVWRPDDDCLPGMNRMEITIILAIVLTAPARSGIISFLRNLSYRDIVDGQTIRALRVPFSSEKMDPVKQDLLNAEEDIRSAFSLMGDEESRTICTCNLRAHLQREYQNTPESIGTTQYLAPNVSRDLRFERFVDCGAYTGDTLSALAKRGKTTAYAGFEPGLESFRQLQKIAEPLTITCSLYPYAVSDHEGTMNFCNVAGSGSLDVSGTTHVPVIRLDDTLREFRPTMIKMDIEGEEFRALLGAREIIEKYRPDLAICVYHYISDLWRIPNLINSWDLGYSFFLRTHSSATMETVLYCPAEVE